jgi:hypothetical protein
LALAATPFSRIASSIEVSDTGSSPFCAAKPTIIRLVKIEFAQQPRRQRASRARWRCFWTAPLADRQPGNRVAVEVEVAVGLELAGRRDVLVGQHLGVGAAPASSTSAPSRHEISRR